MLFGFCVIWRRLAQAFWISIMSDQRSQRLLSTSSSTASFNSQFEPTAGSSLPRPVTSKTCMTAAMKRWRYMRRLLHYQQMDFEFAFWQMVYLISNPRVVYKNCNFQNLYGLQPLDFFVFTFTSVFQKKRPYCIWILTASTFSAACKMSELS